MWWFWIWRVIIATMLMYRALFFFFWKTFPENDILTQAFIAVQLLIRPVGGGAQKRGNNSCVQPEPIPLCESCETRHRAPPLFFFFLPQDSIQTWSARVRMNKRAKWTEMPRRDNPSGGISLWSGSHRLSIHEGNSQRLDFSLKKDKQTNWLGVVFCFLFFFFYHKPLKEKRWPAKGV